MTQALNKGPFELDLVGLRVYRGKLRRRLVRAGTGLFLSPFAITLLQRFVHVPFLERLGEVSGLFSLVGIGLFVGAFALSRRWTRERRATLAVDEGGLRIDGSEGGTYDARPEALETGWVDSREGTSTVVLQKRDGDAYGVRTQNAAEANALLDRLGLGATQRTYDVSFGNRGVRGVLFALLTATATCFTAPLIDDINRVLFGGYSNAVAFGLVLGSYALLAWGLFAIFSPLRVSVGRDGVNLRFSVWKFFLRYATVRKVTLEGDYLYFSLVDGRNERFYAPARPDVRKSVIERIQTALEAYQASAKSRGLRALDRGDRSVSEWRTGVRVLTEGASSYRAEYVDEAMLVATLEDDGAPADRRVGAALALLANDPSGAQRERVRSVASGCASAPLREALEQTLRNGAEGDEKLDRALAEVRRVRAL